MSNKVISDDDYRELAMQQYADDDVMIEDDAVVSISDGAIGHGAWVQAWVWVQNPDNEELPDE